MAYDNLSDVDLAKEAREWVNKGENAMQGAMRRLDELTRRMEGAPSPAPSPTPTPTPTPTPSGWVRADSITPIGNNFPMADWIKEGGPAPSNAPDVVGAFRMLGNVSHWAYDDPIVYPGQPGASHLHEFIGNTEANAFSTYQSLRESGDGTTEGGPLNRSSYWGPALIDGNGMIVCPDRTDIYYKQLPNDSPRVLPGQTMVNVPAGLKMLMGNAYPNAGLSHVHWKLLRGNGYVKVNDKVEQPDLTGLLPLAQPGDTLIGIISAPSWWDGVHIDSPDHISHLSYEHSEEFPFGIPVFTLLRTWSVLDGDIPATWHLSSDMGRPAGSSSHADYFEAWCPMIRKTWWENALQKMLNCSAGDMGNGKYLRRPPTWSQAQRPHLVPVPTKES